MGRERQRLLKKVRNIQTRYREITLVIIGLFFFHPLPSAFNSSCRHILLTFQCSSTGPHVCVRFSQRRVTSKINWCTWLFISLIISVISRQNLNKKRADTFWICPEKRFNVGNTVRANKRPLWRSTQGKVVGKTGERMTWQDSKSAKRK